MDVEDRVARVAACSYTGGAGAGDPQGMRTGAVIVETAAYCGMTVGTGIVRHAGA